MPMTNVYKHRFFKYLVLKLMTWTIVCIFIPCSMEIKIDGSTTTTTTTIRECNCIWCGNTSIAFEISYVFFHFGSAQFGSARSIANKYNTWILLLYNKHISFAVMFVYRRTSLVVNMYEIQGTQCKPSSILPPVDLTQRHNSQFDLSFFRSDRFHADCLLNQLEHDLLIIARLFNKSCYISHRKKSQP